MSRPEEYCPGRRFLEDLVNELDRARSKHRPLNSAHEAYGVILEEVEEFWDEVKKRRDARDTGAMYSELVQIAAMAMRTATELDLAPGWRTHSSERVRRKARPRPSAEQEQGPTQALEASSVPAKPAPARKRGVQPQNAADARAADLAKDTEALTSPAHPDAGGPGALHLKYEARCRECGRTEDDGVVMVELLGDANDLCDQCS